MSEFIHFKNVRELIVKPTLKHLGMHSEAAERLVFVTGIVESRYREIKQTRGPALSWWQIEPDTAEWLWFDYLARRSDIRDLVEDYSAPFPIVEQLPWNAALACALCRVRYWTVRARLPAYDDAKGMGEYWKRYYNAGGAGSSEKFSQLYEEYTT